MTTSLAVKLLNLLGHPGITKGGRLERPRRSSRLLWFSGPLPYQLGLALHIVNTAMNSKLFKYIIINNRHSWIRTRPVDFGDRNAIR
jgi:hypothetical protein